MARFDIISKDGSVVRYSGKPRYNGVYLKPSFLEFAEIASPTPISWEVGDYVDYPRTGMRYRLYSVPQASKNARKDSHGRAFTYSHVQFHAATKELEIALFRDLVDADNNIHFSSSSDVSTFENVEGIARRIQACMDDFYPGRWEIRIADFDATADAEVIKKIGEAKEFALSGGTCLDALSKIYELWQDIGWIHSYDSESEKDVIIIGYPNKRIAENTTDAFVYGKGNGLTAIKKNQTNREEFATRLYVYGSERNLPPRYYNGKDILNAESVDIRNLMIPLDSWGKTDGLPDARKAYLENAEAVAKYGVIPKTHYFDSDDAGANIYPSITGMTIGMIRAALESMGEQDSSYYPSEDAYPDSTQRVDLVRYCDNPTDDGSRGDVALQENSTLYGGKQRTVSIPSGSAKVNIIDSELLASHSFTLSETKPCKVVFNPSISGYVADDGFEKVEVKLSFYDKDSTLALASATQKTLGVLKDGKWQFNLPSISYDYTESPRTGFSAYIYLTITVTLASGNDTTAISYVLDPGGITFSLFPILDKTFLLRLNEIGFDINAQASLGKGKAISMKTGMCAGRTFLIESCRHKSGYWDFTVKRQQDNTLGLIFPNKDYQIAEGDVFVLLDIAMPELYILAYSQELLSEGEKLLARASKIQSLYELSIDAKVMAETGRVLREGMFMEITDEDVVDNTTDYILIDTLSIHEDESAIPTYKVTLKERRKVTYKGTPSATSTDNTESVEGDVQTEVNIDLSEYAKKAEVEEVSELLSSMWQLEGDTIVATKDVRIKANLIVEQDTSSGGEGQDTPAEGTVTGIEVNGTPYGPNTQGVIDLSAAFNAIDVSDQLEDYYTKPETDSAISTAIAAIDLSIYAKSKDVYTKAQIDEIEEGIDTALATKAKQSDLATLQGEVDNIEAVLGLSETAEGYINTWAEVVAFLDGYKNADDLATILAGINADIAKNAEDIATLDNDKADKTTVTALAERVTTAEDAIDDNAGNIKKNFDAIDALDKRVTAEEAVTTTYASWWADLKQYIKVEGSNVKISTNLIVEGDTSSGGSGQDTPASGTVTGIKVNGTTYEPTAGIVTIPDYPTSLTWSAISGKPSFATVATSGSYTDLSNKPTSLPASDVYAWAKASTKPTYKTSEVAEETNLYFTNARAVSAVMGSSAIGGTSAFLYWTGSAWATKSLGDRAFDSTSYLPLAGGTIDGQSSVVLIINSSSNEAGIRFSTKDTSRGFVGANEDNTYGVYIYNSAIKYRLGIRNDGTPYYNNTQSNTLLHSGNYATEIGDYYLKSSGGTIGSGLSNSFPLLISSTNAYTGIAFYTSGGTAYMRYQGGSTWGVTDNGWNNSYTLIHSGNIGSYAALYKGNVGGANSGGGSWLGYTYTTEEHGGRYAGGIISAGVADYGFQLNGAINGQSLAFRGRSDGKFTDWKLIAFTEFTNAQELEWKDTSGTARNVLFLDGYNDLVLGRETSIAGYRTRIQGNSVELRYSTSQSVGLILNSSGNVTIGSSDLAGTSTKLYVDGGIELNSGDINKVSSISHYDSKTGYYVGRRNAGLGVTTGGLLLLSYGATPMSFYTNTTERMHITSSGNVGIGTTSPAYRLDVSGTGNFSVGVKANEVLLGGAGLYKGSYWSSSLSDNDMVINGGKISLTGAVTMSSTLSVTGNITCSSNLIVSGDTSSGSDIRFKDIIKNKTLKIEHIAKAPLFTFKWNDREDDSVHLGSSAQYWEKVCPWLVTGEDFKSLNYATLGVAMGISLAKKAVNHEERIKVLEKENKALKEEIRRMQYGS